MSETTVHIPSEWREAAEEILVHGGPVMVVGAPGAGKSTFCLFLTGYFCRRGGRVAWIDGDPGQPFFGPPAAISLTHHSEPVDVLKRKASLAMGFIGDTSPVGHLLEAVSGLQKLYNQARSLDPDLILINTCGLVDGGAARELKFHEIDMLAPRYVVALQKEGEVAVTAIVENSMEASQNTKNTKNYHISQQLHSWGYIQKNQHTNSKRYMHLNA